MDWFRLKLRPMAVRIDSEGSILPCIDDVWTVSRASKNGLQIENSGRTGHSWHLSRDAVKEFRESLFRQDVPSDRQGMLMLLGFVWLRGCHAGFEPLSLPRAEDLALDQFAAGIRAAGALY